MRRFEHTLARRAPRRVGNRERDISTPGRSMRNGLAFRGSALIFPAWIWSWGGVLLRRSRYLRAPVPPESRSWPFPARLGGAVPTWYRRPNANTLARTHGSLWEMLAWRAPHGEQGGSATGLSATGAWLTAAAVVL